jgi:F-type H+-transporting ATPase subunit a
VEHPIWFTVVVNRLLAKPTLMLLAALHITPGSTEYPIPNHIAMEILAFLIAIVFFSWLRTRISVERPGGTQQCMEMILSNNMNVGVRDLLDDNVGHDGDKYVAMLGSIGIFVLICNLISLIPTLESPTAQVSVPFGCAIVVFLYYNWTGVIHHGPVGYGKHFLGPVLAMSPIMFPIELISNAARLLSLTVRLWVNMFVSEMLYGLFLGLTLALFVFVEQLNKVGYALSIVPLFVPIIFILLHIFVAVLQAFVFTILPVIYVAGAVAEEH